MRPSLHDTVRLLQRERERSQRAGPPVHGIGGELALLRREVKRLRAENSRLRTLMLRGGPRPGV